MHKFLILAAVSVLASIVVACSQSRTATFVYFNEQEGNSEPYRTRMIVTPDYVRFDDDNDKGDFVLFDRRQRVIYSTNSIDRRTLVIHWREIKLTPPAKLKYQDEKLKEQVPPVGAYQVEHYRLRTNDALCFDIYAARGLLPEAVKAMAEFHQTLSVEHGQFMAAAPQQNSAPCDLATNVYQPTRYLRYGFPIHARDYLGRSRQLVDYKTGQSAAAELFRLPKDYQQFTTDDMRGAAANKQK